ncbi:retrovirus-related pol polyprotein from transposon TNT 1-94 [Tanacetum coccineum]|uniref:Retrovirus-related pol polyprotein from transposon TNT 1-94 n=1 Tax=Tanacetum coccineum TaxID=301880 RepID=A0ABQ4WP81_9ASTR
MCVVNILNSVNSTPTVKIVLNKGKQIWKPKGKLSDNSLNKTKRVWKATDILFANVGYQWRPTGKKFALGELCPLTKLSGKFCSKHMTGNRSKLKNFVEKFIGTFRFGNDHVGAIMGYGDYMIGDSVISRVYYVEGLGHNLFSVGQFCDSDLEVAFRKHSCFVHNMDGVDLLKGCRSTNLYTIYVNEMLRSSPICLLSKASKSKSCSKKIWLEVYQDLKFEKDHLSQLVTLAKQESSPTKPKSENTNMEVFHTLHMDLCGPIRVQSINGKKYILVIVDNYSRFIWVKFLRSNDETPEFVINFLKKIQGSLQPIKPAGNVFQPMFDEYFEQSRVNEPVPSATAVNAQVVPPGTSLSTTIAQDAPSTSASSSTSDMHHPVRHQGIAEEPTLKESPITHDALHPLFNPVTREPGSATVIIGNVNSLWLSLSSGYYKVKLDEYGDVLKNQSSVSCKGISSGGRKALYGLNAGTKAWNGTLSKVTACASNFLKGDVNPTNSLDPCRTPINGSIEMDEGGSQGDPVDQIRFRGYGLVHNVLTASRPDLYSLAESCGMSRSEEVRREKCSVSWQIDWFVWSLKKQRRIAISTQRLNFLPMSGCVLKSFDCDHSTLDKAHRHKSPFHPCAVENKVVGTLLRGNELSTCWDILTKSITKRTNTTAEQNVPAQAPIRTDEQIVPRSQWDSTSDVLNELSLLVISRSMTFLLGEGDDPALELAKKLSLDAHQEKGEGEGAEQLLEEVAIRDPVSETTPKLPEVVGKGKAIVTEEQVAHSLVDLSKKKSTTDRFILNVTESGTGSRDPKGDKEQGEVASSTVTSGVGISVHTEDQAGSDPGKTHEALAGPDPEPMQEDQTGSDSGNRNMFCLMLGPNPEHIVTTPTLPEITPFIALQLRVAKLEQDMSEVKKTDYSAAILASIKTQVPIVVDKYLGTKLDDSLLRSLSRIKKSKKCLKEIIESKGNKVNQEEIENKKQRVNGIPSSSTDKVTIERELILRMDLSKHYE